MLISGLMNRDGKRYTNIGPADIDRSHLFESAGCAWCCGCCVALACGLVCVRSVLQSVSAMVWILTHDNDLTLCRRSGASITP